MSVKAKSFAGYKVQIEAGNHRILADEPVGVGDDAGPGPYDLMLSSLAACKIMTVEMYARRKDWPLTGVEVELSTQKVHAEDCADCESEAGSQVDIIESDVTFYGDLTQEQLDRLAEIVDRCPVQRTLTSETKIRTRILPAIALAA